MEDYLINMKTFAKSIILIVTISCNSSINVFERDIKENVIKNVITDYSLSEKRKNVVYLIKELDSTDKVYSFIFYERKWFSPKLSDTVGSKTHSFPTRYLKYKNNLYLWYSKDSIISKDLIKILKNNIYLDSTLIKKEKGEIIVEADLPRIKTDEKKEYFYYFVCKKDISNFVKIKSIKNINVKNYPNFDCR